MPEKSVQFDTEYRVKKKKVVLLSFLTILALTLSACLFDSDNNALSGWLKDQGLPDSYRVQTLTVDGLLPVSAKTYEGRKVFSASDRALLGAQAGISRDLVLDIAFRDSAFFAELDNADSAISFVALYVFNSFYTADEFPSDSLPYEETLEMNVSWKVERGKSKDFNDSIAKIADSTWHAELEEWEADNSADTTYEISVGAKDSVVTFVLPLAIMEDIKKAGPACRLQIRLSAPNAKHMYRFYGSSNASFATIFRMRTFLDEEYKDKAASPFRMANVLTYNEDCGDCLVLHGGAFDSLVVEFPSKEIMEALAEFYGDDFPFAEGDGFDVRQAVVLAQLTFARDDSGSESELGLPVQVVVGSFIDSMGTELRKMENYKLNRPQVVESGHPNMVFFDGDSLSLQVTLGMRSFINQARNGDNFKMMLRLGFPVLQAKDSTYMNYETAEGDTSFVFLGVFDYNRYDFTSMMNQPATLKLWLATKRGEE